MSVTENTTNGVKHIVGKLVGARFTVGLGVLANYPLAFAGVNTWTDPLWYKGLLLAVGYAIWSQVLVPFVNEAFQGKETSTGKNAGVGKYLTL